MGETSTSPNACAKPPLHRRRITVRALIVTRNARH